METINLPIAVKYIIALLELNGYEAYVVGGCVRDSIIGLIPHDWDICTSALPEQVIDVFKDCKVIETGIKHGTVTLVLEDGRISRFYEITTYRVDGEYKDGRHPDSVEFVSNLKQDLSRRDFTINAMAFNPKTGLIDYFGGVQDIHRKVIRCVGKPKKRFKEDALRIMRALRFAMKYNFIIHGETRFAMDILRENLKNVSIERINSEISKMLSLQYLTNNNEKEYLNQRALYLLMLKYLHVINYKITEVGFEEKFRKIYEYNLDFYFNLAITFDSSDIEETLKWLKYPNKTIDKVKEICKIGHDLINNKDWQLDNSTYPARKLLNKIQYNDYETIIAFAQSLCDSMKNGKHEEIYCLLSSLEDDMDDCLANYKPYKLEHLRINGNDLIAIGYKGKQIGKILDGLLDLVMQDKVKNIKNNLISAIPQVIAIE